ncbi:MAG: sialate O-acetylesterase [Desulfobacterales bacterium]
MARIGLKPPRFNGRTLFDNEYYRSFDQYFNDSFSLRSPLIFAKRWLDYRLFLMTDIEEVHVGRNGWLYSRQSIDDYRKEACDRVQEMQRLVLDLHAIEKIIEATGRRFLFVVAPNKSTIYPENVGFVPKSTGCDRSLYDLFLETNEIHPVKSFVGLQQSLLEARTDNALLYDKAATCWNDLGAGVAAESIQAQLIQDASRKQAFDYGRREAGGDDDLARKLMGFLSGVDDVPVMHIASSVQSELSSAIVYGDNFIENLIPHIAQIFNRLEIIRTDSIPARQYGENLRAGDLILLERAESGLGTMRLEIDSLFSTFEAEASIPVRSRFDLMNALPGPNVSLVKNGQNLEVKSVGDRSSFKLPAIPASNDHIFRVLKLTAEAQHADLMTVEYMADPVLVIRKSLKPGIKTMYFPLPFRESLTLKIYPGRKAGVLILQSAEILEFSDIPGNLEPDSEKNSQDKTESASEGSRISSSETQIEIRNFNTLTENMKNVPYHTEITNVLPEISVSTSPALTLNDFEDGSIFQRHGQSADIVVSGTYSGQMEAIEARVIRNNTTEEIVPWTVIDSAPRNGIFVGKLASVPQGGWYNLQVRSHIEHTVFMNGRHKWGVGILIACLGQSNMKEWFFTGKDLKAHSLLRKFSGTGWSKITDLGNAAIAFGNRIIDRLQIPVGLLDFSVNGSGLRKEADWGTGYWEDTSPNSIYDRFISGVSKAGGAVEFVVWIQGEADAARGTVTQNEYAQSLEGFILNQVRSDIANGSGQENLPFLIVMMIKRPGGKDAPHQDIRNAQRHVVENVTDCYLAATTLDLKNHGRQHLTPKAYISMGNRVAQTVLYILGKETYHRGPTGVKKIDSSTIEIAIKHNGGSDFKPVAGITGWEVIADGTSVPIAEAYRHDSQTIRIRLERPLNAKAEIRYLYGAMPDVEHVVLDNSPMSLPLEEYQAEIN